MSEADHLQKPSHAEAFAKLGLHEEIVQALDRMRLEAPTDIQCKMVPLALQGRNCLAQARPGAGKTNAYLLPMLHLTVPGAGLQAILIQPTRALGQQLDRNISRYRPERAVTAQVAGAMRGPAADPPPANPDVLIGTPIGVADMVRRNQVDVTKVKLLVIDELDSMLDAGAEDALRLLVGGLPPRQTLIIAAALDEPTRALAGEFAPDAAEILLDLEPRIVCVEHGQILCPSDDKLDTVIGFCRQHAPRLAVLCVNDGAAAREMTMRLTRARFDCRWIEQGRAPGRNDRGGPPGRSRTEIVVVSDPAPRRLSVIPASVLLHLEIPEDQSHYARRIEHCARLRRDGSSIVFYTENEIDALHALQSHVGRPFEEIAPPERRERPARDDRGRGPGRGDGPHSRGGEPRRGFERGPAGREAGGSDRPPREHGGAPPASERPVQQATRSAPLVEPTTIPGQVVIARLLEPLRRDANLEARGIQPMRRTLGSRFHTTRSKRTQKRDDAPAAAAT